MGETVNLDFSNYSNTRSDYVDPGDYDMQITNAETGESSSGNKKIVVYLEVTAGDSKGLQLVDHLAITDKAMWKIDDFLRGLGKVVPKGKSLSLDLDKLKGKATRVRVDDDEYNGVTNSKIVKYLPSTESREAPEPKTTPPAEEGEPDQEQVQEDAAPTETDEVDLSELDL